MGAHTCMENLLCRCVLDGALHIIIKVEVLDEGEKWFPFYASGPGSSILYTLFLLPFAGEGDGQEKKISNRRRTDSMMNGYRTNEYCIIRNGWRIAYGVRSALPYAMQPLSSPSSICISGITIVDVATITAAY